MGSLDPSRIQKIKPTLVLSPTDLTAASPYGGTLLGPIRNVSFFCGALPGIIRAEEWGGQPVEILQGSDEARLGVVLRAWDSDALAAAVPPSAAGQSGERVWTYQPGAEESETVRPGKGLQETYGVTLCVAPRAPDRQFFLVLYNAVPMVPQTFELQFAVSREIGLGLVWQGLPDDTGRVATIARREDITL